MNKNLIFKVKLISLLYILFVNFFPNKAYLHPLNYNLSKFIHLIIITIASFYDITLAVLLTIVLIMNIIIYETKTLKEAKKIVFTDEIKDKKNSEKQIETIKPENNHIVKDFENTVQSSTIQKENQLPAVNDESMYVNNIHTSMSKELIPDTNLMNDMQSNIYDDSNINKSISPLQDLHDTQGPMAYEQNLY